MEEISTTLVRSKDKNTPYNVLFKVLQRVNVTYFVKSLEVYRLLQPDGRKNPE